MIRTILRVMIASPILLSSAAAWAEPPGMSIPTGAPIPVQAIQTPHNCTCRAKGTDYEVGALICLSTPDGSTMARCEMVLNNTSWTFLKAPCPQS